jgi:hypothetical protein
MAAEVLPRQEMEICMQEKMGTYIKIPGMDGRKRTEMVAGQMLLPQKQQRLQNQAWAVRRVLKFKMKPAAGSAEMPVQASGVEEVEEPAGAAATVAAGAAADGDPVVVAEADSAAAAAVLEAAEVLVAVVLAADGDGGKG